MCNFKTTLLVAAIMLASLRGIQGQVLTDDVSSPAPSERSTAAATLDASIQTQKLALDQAESLLISQGNENQLAAWEELHATSFEDLTEKMELSSAYATFQPIAYLTAVDVPETASPTLEDFLTTAAALLNERIDIHNGLVLSNTQPVTVEAAAQLEVTKDEIFAQEHAAELQAQSNRAKVIGDESAHQPWDVPLPLKIPDGASPQLVALLTVKDQIVRGQVQVHNACCAGSLTQLDAAMEQIQEQQAPLLRQARQLVQALADSTSNQD